MKEDHVYVQHIVECIRRIEEIAAKGREAFLSQHILQDAVLRNLQTLSEATQRLSEGLKATHTDIPWKVIAGFRNILVHDYLGIDLEKVWDTIQNDIPTLKKTIHKILQETGGCSS